MECIVVVDFWKLHANSYKNKSNRETHTHARKQKEKNRKSNNE